MSIQSLPEGSVLLHVGPYKTGSTAIQNALFAQQNSLGEYGVAYPGEQYRAARPGWAVIGWSPAWLEIPDIAEWEAFAAQVRSLRDLRVCVSTEDLGSTGRAKLAQRVVNDLGGENVHVVYVCRALHRVLPSHWQERVKSAIETRTYDEWLRSVLLPDSSDEAGVAFWRSHDLDRVAPAWLAAVGPERLHMIVTDDSDRALLQNTFESMLALPEGFLDTEAGGGNQSMSMNSVELLRRLNEVATERLWPMGEYMELVRQGAFKELRSMPRPDFDERIPPLPTWALTPVAEIAQSRLDTIERLGIDVIGDPESLRLPADVETSENLDPPKQMSMDTAVAFATGILQRDYLARDRLRDRIEITARPAPAVASPEREAPGDAGSDEQRVNVSVSVPRLAEGSVLLHIGPRKTATTGIQAGLTEVREQLEEFGVAYPESPGDLRWTRLDRIRAASPSWAVLRTAPPGAEVPPIEVWEEFADSVRAAAATGLRVCVSSETFANTTDPTVIARIIADLGGDNVHVLYAARALHKLLPSHWQQEVKVHLETRRYDRWLRAVLSDDDPAGARRAFWYAHDVRATLSEWVAATSASNVTVIASDDADRRLIPHTVEQLLGLPEGFIEPDASWSNPSLGPDQVEVLRLLNVIAREEQWPRPEFHALQRRATRGLAAAMPAESGSRFGAVPDWAAATVERLSRERRDAITSSGVRVVGDLDCLLLPEGPRDSVASAAGVVPVGTAANAVAETIGSAIRRVERKQRRVDQLRARARDAAQSASGPRPADLRYRTLVGELVRRPFRRR